MQIDFSCVNTLCYDSNVQSKLMKLRSLTKSYKSKRREIITFIQSVTDICNSRFYYSLVSHRYWNIENCTSDRTSDSITLQF